MKLLLSIVAAVFAVSVMPAEEATAAPSRGARPNKAKLQQQTRVERRAASVGANGLCQRDTGTPTSDLNFRNKCDTEEYWRRLMDRGGSDK